MHHQAAILHLALIRLGIGRGNQRRQRPFGQHGINLAQLRGRENFRFGARHPSQRRLDDRPVRGHSIAAVNVQKPQKIEALAESDFGQELGNCASPTIRRLHQGTTKAGRIGQTFHRTADAIRNPLEITVCHGQIGTYLGGQQAVEIVTAPDRQHRQQQGQDNAQRQQGKQQQANAK